MSAVGDALRAQMVRHPKWQAITAALPLMAIASMDPIDLDDCSTAEARDILDWLDTPGEENAPNRIAMYLMAVREDPRDRLGARARR